MTELVRPEPSGWRLLSAFVVAPIVPAVFMAAYIWQDSANGYFVNALVLVLLFGAYPPAVILGAPAYLFLHRCVNPSAITCASVGGAIAAVPWLTLTLFTEPDQVLSWGLWKFLSVTFALGAVGGLVFWAIAGAALRRR